MIYSPHNVRLIENFVVFVKPNNEEVSIRRSSIDMISVRRVDQLWELTLRLNTDRKFRFLFDAILVDLLHGLRS
jgi:hypothetical protein